MLTVPQMGLIANIAKTTNTNNIIIFNIRYHDYPLLSSWRSPFFVMLSPKLMKIIIILTWSIELGVLRSTRFCDFLVLVLVSPIWTVYIVYNTSVVWSENQVSSTSDQPHSSDSIGQWTMFISTNGKFLNILEVQGYQKPPWPIPVKAWRWRCWRARTGCKEECLRPKTSFFQREIWYDGRQQNRSKKYSLLIFF